MTDTDQPRVGRPRKTEGPAFPAEEVDRLLVHGEPVAEPNGGWSEKRKFPSYRDLAQRFGVSHSLIAAYAKRHNCRARRKQAQARVEEIADEKLAQMRGDSLAIQRDDQLRAIDRYLLGFEEALVEGRVRMDNPSDYNVMSRLKAFLQGEADSRTQNLNGLPTLEEMQARHKEMLEAYEASTPAMRGEIPLAMVAPTANRETAANNDEDIDCDASDGTPEETLN